MIVSSTDPEVEHHLKDFDDSRLRRQEPRPVPLRKTSLGTIPPGVANPVLYG